VSTPMPLVCSAS